MVRLEGKFIYSPPLSYITMSHVETLDEETKRLLAEVNADAQSSTDDSKESNKKEKQPSKPEPDEKDYTWETNTEDTPDSEW